MGSYVCSKHLKDAIDDQIQNSPLGIADVRDVGYGTYRDTCALCSSLVKYEVHSRDAI